jgi:hypothetical protein
VSNGTSDWPSLNKHFESQPSAEYDQLFCH